MSGENQTPQMALEALAEKARLEKEGYQFHITTHSFSIRKKSTALMEKKTPNKNSNKKPLQQYHKNLQDSIKIAKIHEKSCKQ
jgi:hypothetical protein